MRSQATSKEIQQTNVNMCFANAISQLLCEDLECNLITFLIKLTIYSKEKFDEIQ